MEKMTLSQIQQVENQILKHFKEFCSQHHIPFFLSNGTLLGAVKYKGFIPWDDDIDVFVPREDYERLLRLYKDSEPYRLFSIERNPSFKYPFAKLCHMGTRKIEENIDNGVDLGLDIDIFPLDIWAPKPEDATKQVQKVLKAIRLLTFVKCKKAISQNKMKRLVKNVVLCASRWQYRRQIRKIQAVATQYRKLSSPVAMGCISWCIYGEKEIIPAELFSQSVPVEFQGEAYPAPVGYDLYLRSLYGDYTQDPPKDKQVTHHRYAAYFVNEERSNSLG